MLEGSRAIDLDLWVAAFSAEKAGSVFQPWLFSPHCLALSQAVGLNIWKGLLELEGISRQMRLCHPSWEHPLPAICSRHPYRVCVRGTLGSFQHLQGASHGPAQGISADRPAATARACWEPGFLSACAAPFPVSFLHWEVRCFGIPEMLRGSFQNSDRGKGCPGCQKKSISPAIFHPCEATFVQQFL